MPAIRGVYDTHPTTGVAGHWIEPTSGAVGSVIGVPQTTIDRLKRGVVNAAQAMVYRAAVLAAIQAQLDAHHPLGAGAVTVSIVAHVGDGPVASDPLAYVVVLT